MNRNISRNRRSFIAKILSLSLLIGCLAGMQFSVKAGAAYPECLCMAKSDMDKVEWLKQPGTVTPTHTKVENSGDNFANKINLYPNNGNTKVVYSADYTTAGVYDEKGNVLVEPGIYDSISYYGDYAVVASKAERGYRRGVIDDQGKVILEAIYYGIIPVNEKLVFIEDWDGESFGPDSGRKFGIMDTTNAQYVWGPFNLRLNYVCNGGNFLYCDYEYKDRAIYTLRNFSGESITPIQFSKIYLDEEMGDEYGKQFPNGSPGFIIFYDGGILVHVVGIGFGVMKIPSKADISLPTSLYSSAQAPTPTPTPSPVTVNPTPSKVLVNGVEKSFEAYNIGGYNYFKLRDLAFVLSGTDKQFEVGYDSTTKMITLTSGKSYTAVGGEMAPGDGKAKTAIPTPSKIFKDGKEINFIVYNIGGNNFFKLRDLMSVFDIGVTYDTATKAIGIDASISYTE